MRDVMCTLFEKHYVAGAGALLNSLAACKFDGVFVLGFRGPAPAWLSQCTKVANGRYRLAGFEILLAPLDAVKIHFTNYKPQFMRRILAEIVPDAGRIAYIDPDIVVRAPWRWFQDWIDAGVAVVVDINPNLHRTSPLRAAWRRHFEPAGFVFRGQLDVNINGGFVGISVARAGFLAEWERAQDVMAPVIGSLATAFPADRTHPFHMTDQDALNAVLDCTPEELSVLGPEGMDFITGGYVMSHALGTPKPWKKRYLLSALQGKPPSRADKEYWNHLNGALRLMSPARLALARAMVSISSLIGRFWRRG